MFKSLFRRKQHQSPSATRGSHYSAQSTERTLPKSCTNDIYKKLDFDLLEDIHYCHLIGAEALTTRALNSSETTFVHTIQEILKSEETLANVIPRLPDLVPQLLKLLRSEDTPWCNVVDVIMQDSVLVAGVIKVANSPFYRLNVEARDMEQVVMHLGQTGVREVVMSVALKPIMQLKRNSDLQNTSKRVCNHALKSAVACRSIAEAFDVNPFDAYLTGLVHNVGVMFILKQLDATLGLNKIPGSILFKAQLIDLSSALSAKVVSSWNLPQATLEALNDQIGVNHTDNLSGSGELLLHGTAISRWHTLINDQQWQQQIGATMTIERLSEHGVLKRTIENLNNFE